MCVYVCGCSVIHMSVCMCASVSVCVFVRDKEIIFHLLWYCLKYLLIDIAIKCEETCLLDRYKYLPDTP